RYNGQTGAFIDVFVSARSGGLDAPTGLVFGAGGDLYVNSRGANAVLRYHRDTGEFVGTFVPAGSGGLDQPEVSVFGPDGNLYVSSRGTDSVLRYRRDTGAFIDAFVPSRSHGLNDPFGFVFGPDCFVFGPDCNVYLTRFSKDQVLRYDGASGAFIHAFRPATNFGLDQPPGLACGS